MRKGGFARLVSRAHGALITRRCQRLPETTQDTGAGSTQSHVTGTRRAWLIPAALMISYGALGKFWLTSQLVSMYTTEG